MENRIYTTARMFRYGKLTCWAFSMAFTMAPLMGQEFNALPQRIAQTAAAVPQSRSVAFNDFVDSMIQKERGLDDLMRTFNPIIETYIQEKGSEYRFQQGIVPNGDDYFLSRLSLTADSLSVLPFVDEETWNQGAEKYFVHDPLPFNQVAFAQALFPDFGHFDRRNYSFDFDRWEVLGEVRCAAINVRPNRSSRNRGFFGRIWVEDRDHNIVRFEGSFTSKGVARRAFHFNSWRLNTIGNWWMPAYIYTEETKPSDPSSHAPWFKAQTRVWGYDRRSSRDHQANAKQADPPEDFPDLSSTLLSEDAILERSQVAGLIAPDGRVNQILETVANNILITNDLDLPGMRCRVLLTTPLESFVMGRTIVLSRGLLDVLPDEATLAAVLSHELAHIVLRHAVISKPLTESSLASADSLLFTALDFRFDKKQEFDAEKKAIELFSNSPYKDQFASAARFLRVLAANSGRFPILLHAPFSNDFGNNQVISIQTQANSYKLVRAERLDQISALPIGSRIVLDPWSDRVEMLKSRPVRLISKAEKIPFEVTPFYPYLKRRGAVQESQFSPLQ